jgi:hypothetical protein
MAAEIKGKMFDMKVYRSEKLSIENVKIIPNFV